MIASNKPNFFAAHYDWIVVGVGALALVAGAAYFFMNMGDGAESDAANAAARIERMKPQDTGVKAVDLDDYAAAVGGIRRPAAIAEIDPKKPSFLASETRVKCKKCAKAIPGDIKVCPKCPACGEPQEVPVEVVMDADSDGMPDEWEKRYGFNPADSSDAEKDADKDGFTNLEELQAKTDPLDAHDHPPYIDSLKIELPFKPTHLPFVFRRADKIPSGYRLAFFDTTSESATDKRKKGATVTAVIGEEIAKTGFIVKSYTPKSEKRARKGMSGLVDTDVSEVVVQRKQDGKEVMLVVQPKGLKFAAVDIEATLKYERGEGKIFKATPGTELDLNGQKFKVVAVTSDDASGAKGGSVELEDALSAKRITIKTP